MDMHMHMSGEIIGTRKTLVTYFALKRPLTTVGSLVIFERVRSCVSFPTLITNESRHA